jgi:hypothetical protein
MVGALDPAPFLVTGQVNSVYWEVGYGGLVWHTYIDGCQTDPSPTMDTWAGNELLNVGKTIVGATNGLHYALLGGDLVKPLDDLVMTGTIALYNSVYVPLFGLVALVLAVLLFRYIWQGELATISKRGMWALAAMWLAAATYLTPLIYTHILDDILITGTSQVQAGFLKEVGIDERNALPTTLHDQVIYRNWLRGEFGAPDAAPAKQFGRDLVRAQTWTKQEVASGADAAPNASAAKKTAFTELDAKIVAAGAGGYFEGKDGSRTGAGFLALFQAIAFALFQLLAKAAILLAQVLLRVVILAGPVIGLAAMLYPDMLRKVGRTVGAALLNVVVIAALAGMHTLVLTWLFDPARGLPLLSQMLLATVVTIVFFLIGKPMRRMWQMVELSVGAMGSALPAPPGLLSRLRRRQRAGPTPQDNFWEEVRGMDPDEVANPRRTRMRRERPEASYPVQAIAQRIGRSDVPALAGSSWSDGAAALPAADGPTLPAGGRSSAGERTLPAGTSDHRAALPAGRSHSRIVDAVPVVDTGWDRHDEDALLVPSRISGSRGWSAAASQATAPRRAETEVVAGRPVFVLYRPSRGLEVRDGGTTAT